MTRMSQLNFSSGLNPDPAYKWDTKLKLISLAEGCALPSAFLVYILVNMIVLQVCFSKKEALEYFGMNLGLCEACV